MFLIKLIGGIRKMLSQYKDMSPDKARAYMASNAQGTYTLLDVRQDWEYEEEHLPGALHIPLPRLAEALHTIPHDKPVIAYCHSGGRSSAAASMLRGDGFGEVYNLVGGIAAWTGEGAVGPASAGFIFFSGEETLSEIIALACRMEENLGEFYQRMAEDKRAEAPEVADTLERLAGFEAKHKTWLLTVYRQHTGEELDQSQLTASAQPQDAPPLEGGLTAEEFIERNMPALTSPKGVVEAGMMFEAQALDLYMRYAREAGVQESRELLLTLADEEKRHLKALGTLMDRMQPA
ncbi:rhodanese-like domain-containing protein [Desulfobaculum sp.]